MSNLIGVLFAIFLLVALPCLLVLTVTVTIMAVKEARKP